MRPDETQAGEAATCRHASAASIQPTAIRPEKQSATVADAGESNADQRRDPIYWSQRDRFARKAKFLQAVNLPELLQITAPPGRRSGGA